MGGALTPVAALLGVVFGGAAVLSVVLLVAGPEPSAKAVTRPSMAARLAAWNVTAVRASVALAVGVLAALVTGWPVAALLVAATCLYVPQLVSGGAAASDVSTIEAVATWAEMLRDTLAAAGGLQQSIVATAPIAPPVIRPQLGALVDRLRREPLTVALRRFADELDDPTADLVVSALLLAADRSPRQLAPLLGTLAGQARASVASRQRVEAGRARTRSSVRIITLVTIGFAFGLVLLNPSYVKAYGDAAGQLVLLVVGALFGCGLAWIGRSARGERPARLLAVGER